MTLGESIEMEVKVRWTSLARTTYAYGSQVSFEENRVIFRNPQMPPSFVIAQWTSMTNFQGHRSQPELPVLERGAQYKVTLSAEVFPQASVHLKMTYFDRFGKVVGFEFIKEMTGQFTYPEDAFSYTVDLVNSGCEKIVFNYFKISSQESSLKETQSAKILSSEKSENIVVVLNEPNTGDFDFKVLEKLSRLGNLLLIDYDAGEFSGYSSSFFEERFREYLQQEFSDLKYSVIFVGYGPVGNFFSCFYASRLNARAAITSLLGDKGFYKKRIYGPVEDVQLIIDLVFLFRENSERVHIYKRLDSDIISEHSLLHGVMDYSDLLESFYLAL